MAISKQDYLQWFNTYWVPADDEVRKVTDGLDKLRVMFDNLDFIGNGPAFVEATESMGRQAIPSYIDDAGRLIGVAKTQFNEVHTDEQRAVVRPTANATIDNAIQQRDQLFEYLRPTQLSELIFKLRSKFNELFDGYLAERQELYEGDRWQVQDEAMRRLTANSESKALLDSVWEANNKLRYSLLMATDAARAITDLPADDLTVGSPEPAALRLSDINRTVVDNWNEVALKKLAQGDQTAFYEIDDFVIIDAKQGKDQPYVDWARTRNGARLDAKIVMTKRGGAFDPGEITAQGVQDEPLFEAAIKRVSKKKVAFS